MQTFQQCPRCGGEPETAADIYRCQGCSRLCCGKCVKQSRDRGPAVQWGDSGRRCPDCGGHAADVVGLILSRNLPPSPPAPPPAPPPTPEELKQKELERRESALVNGHGTWCDIDRDDLHLIPKVAVKRGYQIAFLQLTGATDDDLRALGAVAGEFRQLRRLTLVASPGVTDAGLVALTGFTTMEEVVFEAGVPRVTAEGVAALRGVLRKCRVTGGPQQKPWWKFW